MALIGVLGGSFDPVHNSHLETAKLASYEFGLDGVIFVPAYLPPHKKKLNASSRDRFNMLVLALEGLCGFSIDKFEINEKKVTSADIAQEGILRIGKNRYYKLMSS